MEANKTNINKQINIENTSLATSDKKIVDLKSTKNTMTVDFKLFLDELLKL